MMQEKGGQNMLLEQNKPEIKAYKRRWIILVIFIYYAAINSFQWIEYAIITNVVMAYYNVSALTVDWTSIIYMALYCPLVIQASYLIDKMGLRTAALVGCIGTTIGTAIKVLSIGQDLFYVVLIGQGILAASQTVILPLPPRLAAVWFRASEVSTACAFGVFGTQLGCAIGFIVPPLMVNIHDNVEDIGSDFRILCWSLASSMIPAAAAVIFYFPEKPPKPPSITQVEERNNAEKFRATEMFRSMKMLFYNKGFNLHTAAYSINIAVFSAVSTLLNQFILQYFPNAQKDAGLMGLLMILSGMVGSVIFGVILDKTHKYKESTFFIYLMSAVSVVGFMYALELRSKILVYIAISIVGFFTSAYWPVGFELAMELTYPSPESTTTGILLAMTQILGVIATLILGKLNLWVGPFWSLGTQAAALVVGTIITGLIPNNLRRQAAFKRDPSLKNNGELPAAIPLREKNAEFL